MSAGICIMNKWAVALAADSAVTIGNHQAIHNSANKLFSLSKVAPVGVVIYSNAELMNVPVEIMIKQYKRQLENKTFDTLAEYVTDFFEHLANNVLLYHFPKNEPAYIERCYIDLLTGMNGDYDRLVNEKSIRLNRELNIDELNESAKEAIKITEEFLNRHADLSEFNVSEYVKAQFSNKIKTHIDVNLKWVPADSIDILLEIIYLSFNKALFRGGYVGMAFSGYGEHDIFPKTIHLHVSGIIDGKVRYIQKSVSEIKKNDDAAIIPLAQSDVMHTFITGVHESIVQSITNSIPAKIKQYIEELDDSCFAPSKKELVQAKIDGEIRKSLHEITAKSKQDYTLPLINSVATLPMNELSLLAESMINITSLRRKVVVDNNIGTVGGPIDVAVISKTDGFIWLKRKHYFDGSYNPQYYYSHYVASMESKL